MKVLNYISTLFVPTKMHFRKNINVFLSFLILLLASYVLAFPYMKTFEPIAYDVYCDSISYNFRVLDEEVSKEIPFTEQEKEDLNEKYTLTTVEELKKIDFSVKNGHMVLPNDFKSYKDFDYNGKEYLLKREVYNYDSEGTKLDQVDNYYIHIVFDLFDNINDGQYRYKDDFDNTLNFKDENHFLIVFYIDGFIFRNNYLKENNIQSPGFEYSDKQDFDFKEINTLDYITRNLSEMLIPATKSQYTFNSFIYAVIGPLAIALCGYIFNKKKNILQTYKHYFNIATLCSIPVLVLFFILEWIELFLRIGIMELYWVGVALYFVIVLSRINRISDNSKLAD